MQVKVSIPGGERGRQLSKAVTNRTTFLVTELTSLTTAEREYVALYGMYDLPEGIRSVLVRAKQSKNGAAVAAAAAAAVAGGECATAVLSTPFAAFPPLLVALISLLFVR